MNKTGQVEEGVTPCVKSGKVSDRIENKEALALFQKAPKKTVENLAESDLLDIIETE